MLHAHIGSGPQLQELYHILLRPTDVFAAHLAWLPEMKPVSLGGGIPYGYRQREGRISLELLRDLFFKFREKLTTAAGRDIRVEVEPGRYYAASTCTLVTSVLDLKATSTNEKSDGVTFAMVDAGVVDPVRPAMHGSYHQIEVVATGWLSDRAVNCGRPALRKRQHLHA